MKKTTFHISGMDCPSEEVMIRMKLSGLNVHSLNFDLSNRNLLVLHEGDSAPIYSALAELKLGASLVKTEDAQAVTSEPDHFIRKVLWIVLWINFCLFVVELVTGLFSRSMGLAADSLDMLADAIVYGMSLYAIRGTMSFKKKVARMSGYVQLLLAVLGLIEVIRRFAGFEGIPGFKTMIVVSLFALLGNVICLLLLQRSKSSEAHIKASMIFTSNDVIVNLGVITAGAMVYLTHSRFPDLIIGLAVFILVANGALRILKLGK
jgi:Co/Zn/Cd efflux system component